VRGKVRQFLLEFKRAVEENGVYLIPRQVCIETLRRLQLTQRNLEEELLGLSVEDYSAGPEKDRDVPGELWIFGKQVGGQEVYVKIKLMTDETGKNRAKCISFHTAERPLKYPLKSRRK
jgi:hypothetical protein